MAGPLGYIPISTETAVSTLKSFTELLTPIAVEDGALRFEISDDWLQGRSAFGGLQAALALQAMRRLTGVTAPLRVLQTTFMAPVPPGPVTVSARALRAGKSVTHVEARIEGDGGTRALFVGVFGAGRPSNIVVTMAPPALPGKGPEGLKDLPYFPGVAPNFIQHYAMRWAEGGWPFSNTPGPVTRIWLRGRDEAPAVADFGEHAAELAMVALTDAIPSPAISWLKTPAPASSLTWTLELLEPVPAPGEGFWRIDSEMHAARDGYIAQTALVCDPGNRPVALSRQSVVIFA